MLKKVIVFLTSLLLILNSTLTNAATIGAWNVSNPMAVGASILYDGSKGAVKSSVLITPNASQVAKVLRGGIAGYALTLAVEQLLGAVDWVLDPANNRIIYKYNENSPDLKVFFRDPINPSNTDKLTGSEACASLQKYHTTYGVWTKVHSMNVTKDSSHYYCSFVVDVKDGRTNVSSYSVLFRSLVDETLSLETVAQKVIENAESDNLDAQFAVLAAANNILSEAEQDDAKAIEDELENNAKCPSGIVKNGSCWICDKSQFMPITRATRDAKTATRGKSCKNVTDTAIKTANATLFRNLINARIQENACWSPPDPNHAIALVDAQNALSLCEN